MVREKRKVEKMICPVCGIEIENDSMICPVCGYQTGIEFEKQENMTNDNVCPVCDYLLKEGEKICPICGTEVDIEKQINSEDNQLEDDLDLTNEEANGISEEKEQCVQTVTSKKSKKKLIVLVILLTVVFGGAIGYLKIYPQIVKSIEKSENQKEAQKVINLIDSIKDKEISTDMKDELKLIQISYNSLSEEQKKLVTNYKELEKILKAVQEKENQEIAEAIEKEIDSINVEKLTAEDNSIEELRKKYDALSEEQKELVSNSAKIVEYEKIVQTKLKEKEEKEQQEKEAEEQEQLLETQKSEIRKLIYNFSGFYGKWGDFGVHINKYQGMIESAIKAEISLNNYFTGAPNNLDMYADSFQWDGQFLDTATCYITFQGTLIDGGKEGVLGGIVTVDSNYNLEFSIVELYEIY